MSRSSHQSPHAKLKTPPRALFSCGIFRNCTQSVLSPTNPPPSAATFLPSASPTPAPAAATPPPSASPTPTAPPPQPSSTSDPPRPTERERPAASTSSSSSSSSTSQSFTQWRFPLQHHHQQQPPPEPERRPLAVDPPAAASFNLAEAFHAAELQFASGARLPALRLLERSLAPDSTSMPIPCPPAVMAGVVASLRDHASARPAAKVLLALLLAEHNRRAAVEAGAASAAVEAVAASGPAGATAERALAALELLCTVPEGAAEVRRHGSAAPALAGAVEGMVGRGRECAVGVMVAIYGGATAGEAPPEVGRAVVAAMQGECSARARRKGAQLLRALQESGRLEIPTDTAIGRP
ncbi:proline-rich receptor-like protein kinase PERK2 [Canna indica]|uniref:Proline-rich receptor-like protein kinase PERK2 n=1 Tax=Canna indica TaxID=4628 RepID=A0AAQ3PW41_9LILI|nr:proline-rich receptor-like protein kinase PERK2 [Canna indica]